MLELRIHRKRGRGLYTTRHVKGGEVVISEAPLLLVVGSESSNSTCANCLRALQLGNGGCQCGGCQQACFCSPQCMAAAQSTPWVHSTVVCSAYKCIAAANNLEAVDADALRFLVHALCLRQLQGQDPEQRYQQLLSLVGQPDEVDFRVAARLRPVLAHAAAVSGLQIPPPEEVAALLRKEQQNSYGILAPRATSQQGEDEAMSQGDNEDGLDDDGERRLRGSAMYRHCSLINHECNPNVARFDCFDSQPYPGNTQVTFRAMHDLPPGTEIFQSYCPLSWEYEERQQHCKEVYGFQCTCARCKLEVTWEPGAAAGGAGTSDSAMAMDASSSAHQQHQQGQAAQGDGEEGPLDPTYLQLFLLKYVCPMPACFGTMAPVAAGADVAECNVCGHKRSEAEFLADLEQGAVASDDEDA